MANKVTVKIYGREYTIMGDKSEGDIIEIGKYVDEQMRYIAAHVSDGSINNVSVLMAINVAESLFDIKSEIESLKKDNSKLKEENRYYLDLWEKSKENTEANKKSLSEIKEKMKEESLELRELRERCDQYESNFFDLQMENIQLKSQLDKYKQKG